MALLLKDGQNKMKSWFLQTLVTLENSLYYTNKTGVPVT